MTPQDLLAQFESFLDEAHRLKNHYASQISILVGAETEFISESDMDDLEKLLTKHNSVNNDANGTNDDNGTEYDFRHGRGPLRHSIEFLVGSIHHVNGIPIDFDMETYEKALESANDIQSKPEHLDGPETVTTAKCSGSESDRLRLLTNFLNSYLDAQFHLLQRLRPEIIGHLDLFRLYTPNLELRDFPEAWHKLDRNVRFAVEYGALFEFNAAAFKKGWGTAYPGREIAEVSLPRWSRTRGNGYSLARFPLSSISLSLIVIVWQLLTPSHFVL